MGPGPAADILMRYGEFQYSHTFRQNDDMAEANSPLALPPAYDAPYDPYLGLKRHGACDECRMSILFDYLPPW